MPEPRSIWAKIARLSTPREAARWLDTPTPDLCGATPLEMIASGREDQLHDLLDRLKVGGTLFDF